ncbi:MAG TPA: AMP-dependent synthetase/ligase [Burkholderiales bacterium]
MNNLAYLLQQKLEVPQKPLYREFVNGAWRLFTAQDIAGMAARWQQAFRGQGFEKGDRVALCLKNGATWVAIDMAALGMGLVVVPLYVNDNAKNIAWCIADSEARLLILENTRMLETLRREAGHLPPIVCIEGDSQVNTLESWLSKAGEEFRVVEIEPDSLATIVYTSGTAGPPKGVKLSHRNILSNMHAVLKAVELHATDRVLSVLPLSHMFERTCGYYLTLHVGVQVIYTRGVQQLAEDLATQQPTILLAVPRVLERFKVRIEEKLASSFFKRQLFALTIKFGWQVYQQQANALERVVYGLLKKLVADPILAKLGGKLRMVFVGGAALDQRVGRTFIGLGLRITQGYGLTETSPVIAGNREGDRDLASVGAPLENLQVRVNQAGELLVRGPSVMLGYWRNPEATRAVLDDEGWLNTGDQVEIRDGNIYIKGRTKDVLVLSNGEKVPPQEVETAILSDGIFEQVMLVGEGRAYLTLLAVTQETDRKKLIRCANEKLKNFPRYIRVRRVIPLKEPWSIENGLLTPTLKVKRKQVHEKFNTEIEKVYGETG